MPKRSATGIPAGVEADGKNAAASNSPVNTRTGKKYITCPVSSEAKLQFDMLAVRSGTSREDLIREALRDLFAKNGLPAID